MGTINTFDLQTYSVMQNRSITTDKSIRCINVNQVDGSYAVVYPLNSDDTYSGSVVIYSPSSSPVIIQELNRVGSLYYPNDAKFDYVRGKLWIADTGNNRVLKVNLNTYQVDLTIDDLIYPHALAVDLNSGNVFIKAYQSYDINYGQVHYFRKDGTALATFGFNHASIESSTSSQSSDAFVSSSSNVIFPSMPSSYSIVSDNMRSRIWWVDGVKVYMCDIRNQQIQSYDIRNEYFYLATTIDIELSTGNAFVVVKNIHEDWFLLQLFRDNNRVLGSAYIHA